MLYCSYCLALSLLSFFQLRKMGNFYLGCKWNLNLRTIHRSGWRAIVEIIYASTQYNASKFCLNFIICNFYFRFSAVDVILSFATVSIWWSLNQSRVYLDILIDMDVHNWNLQLEARMNVVAMSAIISPSAVLGQPNQISNVDTKCNGESLVYYESDAIPTFFPIDCQEQFFFFFRLIY